MASGLENIETIESPFRRFVTTIGVFPTAFTDAMTYYECLAYLVKYIEDSVVPALNENAEALKELQKYYVQLKSYVDNYFDNLDVQDEINNKLDEMAEAGTLQEIITAYIQSNVAWTFDTVADMKQATNLVDGSYARTLGFHTLNDGGGALYKITNTGTANEMDIIAVGNLKAHLIYCNEMNLTQFGVNHSSSDVTSSFNNAVSICANNGIKLIIPAHTYNLATITTKDVSGYHYKYFIEILPNMQLCGADKNLSILKIPSGTLDYTTIFFSDEENVDNIKLENFTIDQYYTSGNNMGGADRSNRKNVFTMYGTSKNIVLDNLNLNPCCGIDPIAFHNQNIKNVRVTNNNFNYHYVQNINWYDRSVVYMECSDYVVEGNTVNGNFETIGGIECHGYNGICKGNTVKECKFAIYIAPRHDDTITHCNIMVIDNLIFDSPCGVQIFGNTYPSSTVGTNGIMVNGNNIKSEGSVLSQNFWTQSGLANATVFSGIQINPDTVSSYSDLHICNNSISIHNYAPYKASVSSSTVFSDTGISTFGKVDIDGAFITGNHIEGIPGPGIAIAETRASASDFHTTQNVHITDNNVINCGYGPTDTNPYKAFIRIGFGIIKNVIIRNNILNKTDSSYATASAIYNQSNNNCSKTNLYCDHNILTSVVSDEFKVTSNSPFDMITDKGIASDRPTTANIGDQYYDTAFNKVIVWNGRAWINVNGSAL